MDNRASWDDYFIDLAEMVGQRATCSRRQVGAVVVRDRIIQSTGYNGGPSGYPHCLDGACPRAASDAPSGSDYDKCIAIHAEANAIMFSSPEQRKRATIYTTLHPCFGCAKLIANSGITEVVTSSVYEGHKEVQEFLRTCNVRVRVLGYATNTA